MIPTQMFSNGGPVFSLLIGLSVLTLAVFIAKLLQLAPRQVFKRHAANVAIMAAKTAPLARQEEVALNAAQAQLATLRKGAGFLDLMFNLAPLLGLFGTILGMIDAFQSLEAAGTTISPSQLAGGIWTALLTTAAGLVVAMVALGAVAIIDWLIECERARTEEVLTRHFVIQSGKQEESSLG